MLKLALHSQSSCSTSAFICIHEKNSEVIDVVDITGIAFHPPQVISPNEGMLRLPLKSDTTKGYRRLQYTSILQNQLTLRNSSL